MGTSTLPSPAPRGEQLHAARVVQSTPTLTARAVGVPHVGRLAEVDDLVPARDVGAHARNAPGEYTMSKTRRRGCSIGTYSTPVMPDDDWQKIGRGRRHRGGPGPPTQNSPIGSSPATSTSPSPAPRGEQLHAARVVQSTPALTARGARGRCTAASSQS